MSISKDSTNEINPAPVVINLLFPPQMLVVSRISLSSYSVTKNYMNI